MLHQTQHHHHHHSHLHHSSSHQHQHVPRSGSSSKKTHTDGEHRSKKHSSHHSSRRADADMAHSRRRIVNIQLDIHFDLLCPWCYCQKKNVENATARFASEQPGARFQIVYKPFYLFPVLRKGIDKKEFTESAFGAGLPTIKNLAASYGLDISLSGQTGPTRNAHVLVALAGRLLSPERQSQLIDLLFRGHFTDGEDLSYDLYLLQVGKKVGLPEDVIRAEFAKGEAGMRIDEEVRRAEIEDNIVAVPCVTIQEKYRVGGYQIEEVFARMFERVWIEEEAA